MAKKAPKTEEEFDFTDIVETNNSAEEFDFTDIVEPSKKKQTSQPTSKNPALYFGAASGVGGEKPTTSKSPSESGVSPLQGIKGVKGEKQPEQKPQPKIFEIKKLPSERPEFTERLQQNVELEDKLLNDPTYALLSDSDEKRVKIYSEKNKAVAAERGQTLDELYSDMDEYLADFLDDRQKQEYIGKRGRVDLLKRIAKAKAEGQPTEQLEKDYDEMVKSFSQAKAQLITDADARIKELRLTLEETPTEERGEILDEIKILEASKKPFFTDTKQAAAQIVKQEGLKGGKSDQEKVREYAHSLMRERSDLREMLGMKGTQMSLIEAIDQMTLSGDDPVVQRLIDVETKLKSVAPIALINETPITEKEGALQVLGKEFLGSVSPTTKSRIPTQQSIALNTLEGLGLAGVDMGKASKDVISTIEKTSQPYEDWSAKDIAQMTGTTMGFLPKFVVATMVTEGAASLSIVSPYWRSIKMLSERGSLGGAAGNNVIRTLQSTPYGRGLLKTGFGGVEFGTQSAVESAIFQADKDEVGFITGIGGGATGKLAGMGMELAGKGLATTITALFGNKAPEATNKLLTLAKTAYGKTKEVNEKAIGEVGEETGESLAGLWQESENGQQFLAKIGEEYGDPSKALKFFLSTYMMGFAFGSGTYMGKWSSKKSGEAYQNLSPKDKAVADNIISEIKQEQNKAETDAGVEAIQESDLPEIEKQKLQDEVVKQGEVINSVIEGETDAKELEQFVPSAAEVTGTKVVGEEIVEKDEQPKGDTGVDETETTVRETIGAGEEVVSGEDIQTEKVLAQEEIVPLQNAKKLSQKIKTEPSLTVADRKELLTPNTLKNIPTEDYVELFKKGTGRFVSHVVKQGVKTQDVGWGMGFEKGAVFNNFKDLLKNKKLSSSLDVKSNPENMLSFIPQDQRERIKSMNREDAIKEIVDAINQHDEKIFDTDGVHFSANAVSEGYGAEYPITIVYPSEYIHNNYKYLGRGSEISPFNNRANENAAYNDVSVTYKGDGISIDDGIVVIPKNIMVNSETGSQYKIKDGKVVKDENGNPVKETKNLVKSEQYWSKYFEENPEKKPKHVYYGDVRDFANPYKQLTDEEKTSYGELKITNVEGGDIYKYVETEEYKQGKDNINKKVRDAAASVVDMLQGKMPSQELATQEKGVTTDEVQIKNEETRKETEGLLTEGQDVTGEMVEVTEPQGTPAAPVEEFVIPEIKNDTFLTKGITNLNKLGKDARNIVKAAMDKGLIPERLYNEFGEALSKIRKSKNAIQKVAQVVSDFIEKENTKDDSILAEIQRIENLKFEQEANKDLVTDEDKFISKIEDKEQFGDELTQEELDYVNQNYFKPEGFSFDKNWGLVKDKKSKSQATTKPTKAERKAIASAKIDEVANALKDILPSVKGVEKMGTGQDEIIDLIAKAVKALVNTGIEIDEAIKQVKARLSEVFDGVDDIDNEQIKGKLKVTERLTPETKEAQDQKAKDFGFKNASHATNKVNKETGSEYETFESIPDEVLKKVGATGERRFSQQFIREYPELAGMLSEGIVNYAKMPNKVSLDMANALIEEVGLEEARTAFMDMRTNMPAGARMVLGQLVIKKLEQAGRVDEAIEVLEDVTKKATEMGQEIQALSMFAFLSPEGQLRYAQRTINKENEKRSKIDKGKTDKIKKKLKKANKDAIDETLQTPKVKKLMESADTILPKGLSVPETRKPRKYLISDERLNALRKQARGKFFSGVPVEVIEIGVAYAERGAYKFADFSRVMIREFGNKVKPYLKEIYTKATDMLVKEGYEKAEFDTAEQVDTQIATERANAAVAQVEKAIKAKNKKAIESAIANLQNVAKETGLWGKYKTYAVSRLKQLTNQNISEDIAKMPPLDEFTSGLVKNIRQKLQETADPKEREKIAKRPAIEIIGDAFRNTEKYADVLEQTQKEIKEKYKDSPEKLAELDAYFGEIMATPFSEGLVKESVREGLKEMGVTLADIVKQHYTVYDATKRTLTEKLIEQAGLEGREAEVLAQAIQNEFDKIATEKKQNLLDKILSNKTRKKQEVKNLEVDLIRLTNLGAFSDEQVIAKWAEKMGYPKLTEKDAKEIKRLSEKVQEAQEGFQKFRAIEDLLSYQANLKGVSKLDVGVALWYANILSGYKTQEVNLVANLINASLLYANAVAQRPQDARFIATGFINGLKRGMLEAKETFRTGYSPIRGKVEVPSVLERKTFEGWAKPLNYAKYVGRLMKASDVLVFEALKEMRAYQLAAKEAANMEGIDPNQSVKDKAAEIVGASDYQLQEAIEQSQLEYEQELEVINSENLSKAEKDKRIKQAKIDQKRRVYEILEEGRNPEIQSEVANYAARGTYNYKPEGVLGWMASTMNNAKDALNRTAEDATNPYSKAAANTAKVFVSGVVPFTNIIANVANEALNYTPVGLARRLSGTTALTYNRKELTDQEKADLMTKAVIGNSLMVAIYLLATVPTGDDDEPLIEITANGTGDFRKNFELQADGWQPYSIRVGNTWISYQYSPLMTALSYIGNIKDYEKYRGEKLTDMAFGNQAAVAFGSTFRALLDMTFLANLNQFLSAAADPRNEDRVSDFLKAGEKTVSGVVVPNLYTQLAKDVEAAFGVSLKETTDERFGATLQHIPFFRDAYYNKLDALGDEIIPDTDKFISISKDSPLWGLIAEKGAFIGKPSIKRMKVVDPITEQERFYTQDEYYRFGKERGALIKKYLTENFEQLSEMPSKDVKDYVEALKTKATDVSRVIVENKLNGEERDLIISNANFDLILRDQMSEIESKQAEKERLIEEKQNQ